MTLSAFIIDNMDLIHAEWEAAIERASPLGVRVVLPENARDILEAAAGISSATPRVLTPASMDGQGAVRLQVQFAGLRQALTRLWLSAKASDGAYAYHELSNLQETIDRLHADSLAFTAKHGAQTRAAFLSLLGHDLRTPISAIRMACQYLANPDAPAPRRVEAMERISRSAVAMDGMVKDVLEFTRSALGRGISINCRQAHLGDLCRTILEQASAEHPRCEFRLAESGELASEVDTARIRQAVGNLIANAAHHHARGSEITVTAKGEPDAVIVEVQYQGVPLSAHALKAIFDPVGRAANTLADPDGSMHADLGLGLFVAREIARAHGGDVTVTSSTADGIVFSLKLPRAA